MYQRLFGWRTESTLGVPAAVLTTRPGTGFDYSLIRMLGIKPVRVDSCSVYSCVYTVYLRGLLTRASNKLPAPKTF
jgi:hypothetical protein